MKMDENELGKSKKEDGVLLEIVQSYHDKELQRIVEPGEKISVSSERAHTLLTKKVAKEV